jgi:hypothetical protein
MPRKNSLVANINRRKRAGKSRPKSRSKISKSAYRDMQRGWPRSKAAKKKAAKKQAAKKQSSKRGSTKKSSKGRPASGGHRR